MGHELGTLGATASNPGITYCLQWTHLRYSRSSRIVMWFAVIRSSTSVVLQTGRESKRKQEEARESKRKQEEARKSKRKQEKARKSKRKQEKARKSKKEPEKARGSKRKQEDIQVKVIYRARFGCILASEPILIIIYMEKLK